MATHESDEPDRTWRAVGASLFVSGLILSLLSVMGADLLWLVAMGDHVRATGSLPDEVAFAAASSEDWPPVLLLSELVLSVIHEAGLAGVLVWHYLMVLAALALVALGARHRGASDLATSLVVVTLLLGGIATFGVVRLQTFSLLPFVLVLMLVRSQHERPSRAIWWAPPLIALWGNLHGSVLLGVCVIGAYLLCSRLRLRPAETLVLGMATLLALFVNPASWRTPAYYVGVVQNAAAVQKEGLWAAPSVANPFDVLMVVTVLLLGAGALRRRLPLWEYVALLGLTVATVGAARNGIWLLLLVAVPAAYGLTKQAEAERGAQSLPGLRTVGILAAALSLCGALLAFRSQAMTEADATLASEVQDHAPGRVVLAPEPFVESLAVRGVRVWLANPLDAFDQPDQRAYLDFMSGRPGMSRAVAGSGAVLVRLGTPAESAMAQTPGFDVVELSNSWLLYVRP